MFLLHYKWYNPYLYLGKIIKQKQRIELNQFLPLQHIFPGYIKKIHFLSVEIKFVFQVFGEKKTETTDLWTFVSRNSLGSMHLGAQHWLVVSRVCDSGNVNLLRCFPLSVTFRLKLLAGDDNFSCLFYYLSSLSSYSVFKSGRVSGELFQAMCTLCSQCPFLRK